MKNVHLFICLFIFHFAVTAQNQSIDSLRTALKTLPQGIVRVNVLNDISTAFIQIGHFDSAFRYSNSSIDLVDKLRYQTGSVMAYHNLAAYNFHIKEYKIGKFFLLKSLNAALLTKDKKNIANDYKELADLYQLQSNFKQAKESNKKYGLYRDSMFKEESAKQDAEAKKIDNINPKENTGTSTDNVKVVMASNEQKQPHLYIALGVLLALSILIIWLMISRAKIKANGRSVLLTENAATEQHVPIEKSTQLKNVDDKNAVPTQKITKKELLPANLDIENGKTQLDNIVPGIRNDGKKLVDEKPTEKIGFNESIVLADNKTANNDVIEIEEVAKQTTPIILNRNYSNIIFTEQLPCFTAKLLRDKIKLVWKTADERNIMKFELEKSVDGVQFVGIETFAAKGFGSNDYETVDFKPLPGTNYYRLEIIDTDGNFIHSPIAQVETLPASTLALICYPTHVKDVMMITAAGGKLPVSINIFNESGKKEFTIDTPPITTLIYLPKLAPGKYTLQMKCQGKTLLQQLTKM